MRQLTLFDSDAASSSSKSSSFRDPASVSNKSLPIHRWVPWIAGFSSKFVRDVLDTYLNKSTSTVLDPFAGVGTTLLETVLLGHRSVGFEINPYAALACRIKTSPHLFPAEKLAQEILRFQTFYNNADLSNYTPKSRPPEGFKTRSEFYSPRVLRQVLLFQDFLSSIKDSNFTTLFRLAFASTMVRYSNYSYEPSLGRRASAGKGEILDFPVGNAILSKLREMADDLKWLQARLSNKQPDVQIFNDSFFNYRSYLPSDSIDLIVTSPPYLNNYHYNRNTRPQLYWLGYVEHPKDMKPLEESNFGKYWQTVRNKQSVDLEFRLPDTDLEDQLRSLRKLNSEKGIYGGNGWANYAASYFNDCHRFAHAINHLLKPGGTALIVLGNSILQGIMIPTDLYMGRIAESVGLELVRIEVPRTSRVGNSIIQSNVRVGKAKDSHQLYESIVELRKR